MMETTDIGTDGSPERPPTASTGEQGTENPPDTPVTDAPPAGSGSDRSPARLAVGLVLLAADRLRISDAVPAPARTALATSLGLAGQAAGAVRHRRREAVRTVRAVAGTVDRLANRVADDHRTLNAPARRGATAVRDRGERARRAGGAVGRPVGAGVGGLHHVAPHGRGPARPGHAPAPLPPTRLPLIRDTAAGPTARLRTVPAISRSGMVPPTPHGQPRHRPA
jgi:hypothetical protein